MKTGPRPWFRLWSDAVDDEKLRLLAFEDRWHFVALMCCKSQGILDSQDHDAIMRRKVAVKLGLQVRELEEVARRLSEVDLINSESLQPLAWCKRQFESDLSTERVRRFREAKQGETPMKRFMNVSETPPETETETDTEKRGARARRFSPPSAEEVAAYCTENRYQVDSAKFCDHYTAKGWKIGTSPMKDWKAAVRTWTRNGPSSSPPTAPSYAKSKPLGT